MAFHCSVFHTTLAPGTPCPLCQYYHNPGAGPSKSSQSNDEIPPTTVSIIPTPTPTPIPAEQAQYTPVTAGTVATVRQTIGKVNAYRATPPAKKATPEDHPTPQEFTKFGIRVAHARYLPRADPESTSPPALAWTVYTDQWGCAINNKTPITFDGLKDVFRDRGQTQYIDHLLQITSPKERGCWTMSTNWLVASNPVPHIWFHWEGEYLIQDAISIQDYPKPGKNGKQSNGEVYPVTLLWYPKLEGSPGFGDPKWAIGNNSLLPPRGPSPVFNRYDDDWDALESVSELFARQTTGEGNSATTTGGSVTTAVPNTAHKRQISKAIPSNERPNAPEEEQEDPKVEGSEGTRKSSRARKPKRK